MFRNSYKKEVSIFQDDFSSEKSIICSINELVDKEIESGRNILFLKEDSLDFVEIFAIQTHHYLDSETELIFCFDINSYLASFLDFSFQLKINGIVIECNRNMETYPSHKINVHNLQTKKGFGIFFPFNDYAFFITLRRIRNRCYLFNKNSLISEFSFDNFDDLKDPISVSWLLKKKHKIDLTWIELRKIKIHNEEYYFENDDLRFFLNEIISEDDDHLQEDSIYYYLHGKGERIFLERENKHTQYKRLYVALFEITKEGTTYFCLNWRRISFLHHSNIAKITNHKNRICDNPELIKELINGDYSLDQNIVKIIDSMECFEFNLILKEILEIRFGINKSVENYINAEYRDFKNFDFSELIPSCNNFDYKFITKENTLVIGSNADSEVKQISYEIEDPKLVAFDLSIGIDITNAKTVHLNCFDFGLEISFTTEADISEMEFDNSEDFVFHSSFFEVYIYYFNGSFKKTVLKKAIPYLYRSYCEIRIQKNSDYFFFTLNDIYLGCYLRYLYPLDSSDFIPISIKSNEKNALIKVEKLMIREIVKHGFMDLADKIKDFKSDKLFYISIWRDNMVDDGLGVGYNNIYITKISSLEKTEEIIISRFYSVSNSYKESFDSYTHHIVTNDYKLINKYRNAIDIVELLTQTTFMGEALNYFALVLLGFCIQCRSFEQKDNWNDPSNGVNYTYTSDSGWIICNREVYSN